MTTPLQFIEAIEKNGLKQTRGTFFRRKDGNIISACAVGQAMINLNLHDTPRIEPITQYACPICRKKSDWVEQRRYLVDLAVHLNDIHRCSLKSVGRNLREAVGI